MLPGICPQSPNDFFIGSTTTLAADSCPCNVSLVINLPATVVGMLPLRQLSLSPKNEMFDDSFPEPNHAGGRDPAQCAQNFFPHCIYCRFEIIGNYRCIHLRSREMT